MNNFQAITRTHVERRTGHCIYCTGEGYADTYGIVHDVKASVEFLLPLGTVPGALTRFLFPHLVLAVPMPDSCC